MWLLLLVACHAGDSDDPKLPDSGTASLPTGTTAAGTTDTDTTCVPHVETREPGPWKYVSAGIFRTCAISVDGPVDCWGNGPSDYCGYYHYGSSVDVEDPEVWNPPDVDFTSIDLNDDGWGEWACGLSAEGELTCWGVSLSDEWSAYRLTQVEVGMDGIVGLDTSGHTLSGLAHYPEVTISEASDYVAISNAYAFCRVEAGLGVECLAWETVPFHPGDFTAVASDWSGDICALTRTGEVACWDVLGDTAGWDWTAPTGSFTSLTASYANFCGITSADELACWGIEYWDILSPPAGTYTQVDCGFSHCCAVTTEGEVNCWGECAFGEC